MMYLRRFDPLREAHDKRRALGVPRLFGLILLLTIGACAIEPARGPRAGESADSTLDADSQLATEPAETRARPGRPARMQVDPEIGFTISEMDSIDSAVRADYQRALLHLETGNQAEGIALLIDIIEQAPSLTAPFINLGIAYGRAGELENAESSLRDALILTPGHPVAHNELGIVYRRMGRFESAKASYEQALTIHPGFHYARRNLAVLCDLYLADPDCALENYERYQAAGWDDAEVALWLRDLRNRTGDE